MSNYRKLLPWIHEHVGYQGDGCLIWPFGRRADGRGRVRRGGNPESAARVMCELAHGPAPSPLHEAAHSCGKGALGCMSPKHIRWATPQENHDDRIAHGTVLVGEKNPSAKLTEPDVLAIINRLDRGETLQSIADDFGVTFSLISCIKLGKAWGWLTGRSRKEIAA